MKKFFKKISRKVDSAMISAKCALESRKGEGYVDTGVKVLIAAVLGALVLSSLYALLKTGIMTPVTTRINDMFSYTA